jgi:hypothetical protein
MTAKDTPAFPGLHPSEDCRYQDPGMTLRDYFAANVIQGICASGPSVEWTSQRLAEEAYSLADSMLEAREK